MRRNYQKVRKTTNHTRLGVRPSSSIDSATGGYGYWAECSLGRTPDANLAVEAEGSHVVGQKGALRLRLLEKRLSLDGSEVVRLSRLITAKVLSLKLFSTSKRIGLYFPHKNEVSTEEIFLRARLLGKEVFYPRTKGSSLEFAAVEDLGSMVPGRYGIPEPHPGSQVVSTGELDVVFIPGIGFDWGGNRLGYGCGYFDRYLRSVSKEKRVGLCYSFQLVPSIPTTCSDEPVGMLVTEYGAILCEGGRL